MKLFLTWLLGVPALVLAMVMARAMSPDGLQPLPVLTASAAATSACVRQRQLDKVRPVVVKNGHRIRCDRRAVK
jgi:hypothetical protein